MNKLYVALAGYVAIGLIAWFTLPDERIRLVTLAILGLLVMKTLVADARMK